MDASNPLYEHQWNYRWNLSSRGIEDERLLTAFEDVAPRNLVLALGFGLLEDTSSSRKTKSRSDTWSSI